MKVASPILPCDERPPYAVRGFYRPPTLEESMFSSPETAKQEAERRIARVTEEAAYVRSRPPLRRRLARFFYDLAGRLEPELTRPDRETA